jgi:hypothetical protein
MIAMTTVIAITTNANDVVATMMTVTTMAVIDPRSMTMTMEGDDRERASCIVTRIVSSLEHALTFCCVVKESRWF